MSWNINAKDAQQGKITIMDITGKIVMQTQEKLERGFQNLTFDVANLPSGTYTITLVCENKEHYAQKFIKIN